MEVRTVTGRGQEPGGRRPWKSDVYWFAVHALLSLLSYRNQDDHPRIGINHNGQGTPTLITNLKKLLYMLACTPNL